MSNQQLSRELGSNSLRTEYLHKLSEILLNRRFVCYSSTHWCIQLLIYISIGLWVFFYTLGYHLKLHCCANCSVLAIDWEVFRLSPVTLWYTPIHGGLFVLAFPYFLAQWDISGSICISPASGLEYGNSPRSPGSFSWRIILANKIHAPSILGATGASLLCRPSLTEQGNICECTNPRLYVHLYISLYVYITVYISLDMSFIVMSTRLPDPPKPPQLTICNPPSPPQWEAWLSPSSTHLLFNYSLY